MTAAAPNLAALLDAARAEPPDRVALLLLGEMAEDEGTPEGDARAESWRWLADPPAEGWERRAWETLGDGWTPAWLGDGWEVEPAAGRGGGIDYRQDGVVVWRWSGGGDGRPWRQYHDGGTCLRDACPPAVRAVILAACRAALAGTK